MAALTLTPDRSTYNVGDPISVTVTNAPGVRDVFTDETHTFSGVDLAGNSGTATITVHRLTGESTLTITDSASTHKIVLTLQGADNGVSATFVGTVS